MKCHQVATLCGEKWDNWLDIHRRVYGTDGLCPTIHCRIGGGTERKIMDEQARVRKLTPLECWRLQGFEDEDFEKAAKVCSNTQLYKQAGNSITVQVLEGILRNLISQDEPTPLTDKMGWLEKVFK